VRAGGSGVNQADYKNLKPDHFYGYTTKYLQANLSHDAFSNLQTFMIGQTSMLDEVLGCGVIYTCDYENWLAGGRLFWD
jgi:hypothetical protein